MAKIIKLSFLLIFLAVVGFFGFTFYSNFYLPNQDWKGGDNYSFEVKQGDTIRTIAQTLVKDNVVKDANAIILQNQFNPVENLQTGIFTLKLPASPSDIISQINTENINKIEEKEQLRKRPTTTVTIREGITLDQVIDVLIASNLSTREDLTSLAQDPNAFDKQQFAFLPPSQNCQYGNYKTCVKYYLEGYLYPDTYTFFQDASARDIYERMLTNFRVKVWQTLNPRPTSDELYKIITMASVVEKETGRPISGINSSNIEEVNQERATIAGVFFNRITRNMEWASDPTVSYGTGRRVCQSTLKVENCLFLDSPEVQSKYNTYNNKGYPIGPITSPQADTIKATQSPIRSDYIFFVSDGTGKKYFAVNFTEHQQNISRVQQFNRQSITR